MTQTQIKLVFDRLYENQLNMDTVRRFTASLNKVADKNWSDHYIYNVLRGYKNFSPTTIMIRAANQVMLNGMPTENLIPVEPMPGVILMPGAILMISSRVCDGPGCSKVFIPPYASQRYCSQGCKNAARNKRKREKRKELRSEV